MWWSKLIFKVDKLKQAKCYKHLMSMSVFSVKILFMMVLGPLGFWLVVHILIFWHLWSILSIFQLIHLWSEIQHIFGLPWAIFYLWHLTFDINDNIYSILTTQYLLQTPSHYNFPLKNLLVSLDTISIDLLRDIF